MSRLYILLLTLFSLTACQAAGGQLHRPGPTSTPWGVVPGEPEGVTFSELNERPALFRNRLIRVRGDYVRLPAPTCAADKGPMTSWALVEDELRLDARGLEWILPLVPPGTPLVIDGYWWLYEGPLGCGKGAPPGEAWFLEAVRIVQPNPLPGAGAVATAIASPPTAPPLATPVPGATAGATTATATATASRAVTATPLITVGPGTTATTTRTPPPIATVTPGDAPGTTTATATATRTLTPPATASAPTAQPTSPPQPPLNTPTPGGDCGGYPCQPTAPYP